MKRYHYRTHVNSVIRNGARDADDLFVVSVGIMGKVSNCDGLLSKYRKRSEQNQ